MRKVKKKKSCFHVVKIVSDQDNFKYAKGVSSITRIESNEYNK